MEQFKNVGTTLVVRKCVHIESLSEPFYPVADDVRAVFSKFRS